MTQWQQAWHAIAKRLPLKGLEALSEACRTDDPRLIAGTFVNADGCGCAVGYAILKSRDWRSIESARWCAEEVFLSACELKTAFTMKFDDELNGGFRKRFLAEFQAEVDRAIIDRKAEGLVELSDEWWETENTAFGGMTPIQELAVNGRKRLESMLYHLGSGVAS